MIQRSTQGDSRARQRGDCSAMPSHRIKRKYLIHISKMPTYPSDGGVGSDVDETLRWELRPVRHTAVPAWSTGAQVGAYVNSIQSQDW